MAANMDPLEENENINRQNLSIPGQGNQAINAQNSQVSYNPDHSMNATFIQNFNVNKLQRKGRSSKPLRSNREAERVMSLPSLTRGVTDSDDSSQETVSDVSEISSLSASECDQSIERSFRYLILGDSTSANGKVRHLLLSEGDDFADTEVSSNSLKETHDGNEDIRVHKTLDKVVIENSSLFKHKCTFLEKFDLVSRLCKLTFPSPNIILIVVTVEDNEDVCRKVKTQLSKAKKFLLGAKIEEHVVIVFVEKPLQVDSNIIDNKKLKKVLKGCHYIVLKADFKLANCKMMMSKKFGELAETNVLSGNRWFGKGAFLTTNKLIHSAVKDLKREVKTHFSEYMTDKRQSPFAVKESKANTCHVMETITEEKTQEKEGPNSIQQMNEETKDENTANEGTSKEKCSTLVALSGGEVESNKKESLSSVMSKEAKVDPQQRVSTVVEGQTENTNHPNTSMNSIKVIEEFPNVKLLTKETGVNTEINLNRDVSECPESTSRDDQPPGNYDSNGSQRESTSEKSKVNTDKNVKIATREVGTNTDKVGKKTNSHITGEINYPYNSKQQLPSKRKKKRNKEKRVKGSGKTKTENIKHKVERIMRDESNEINSLRNCLENNPANPRKRKHEEGEACEQKTLKESKRQNVVNQAQ